MSNKYERKYKVDELIEKLILAEDEGKNQLDIEDLLDLIGFDLVDIYFFYVNRIRGRFRFGKDYKDSK